MTPDEARGRNDRRILSRSGVPAARLSRDALNTQYIGKAPRGTSTQGFRHERRDSEVPERIIASKDPPVARRWMPYAKAAHDYLGVSPDILRRAINEKKLPAYEKPLTRGRKEGAAKQRHSWFVHLSDVDEYVRTYWNKAERI